MVRMDGTMTAVSNHVLTARTHYRRLLVRGSRRGSSLLFLHVAEARSKLALGHRPRSERRLAELAIRRPGVASRTLQRLGQSDAVHRVRGRESRPILDDLQRHPPGREPADTEGAPRRHRRLRRPVPVAQVRHRAGQPARPAPLRATRAGTIRLRPVARPVSPGRGATASTSTSARAQQGPGPEPPRRGRPGGQRRHAEVAGPAALAGGADRHRDRGPAGLPDRRPLLPGLLRAPPPGCCRRSSEGSPATASATPTTRWSARPRPDRSACMAPARPLPARESGRPYASRLVRWQGSWYLLGDRA